MNFKQKYLLGLCDISHIEDCTEEWHQLSQQNLGLIEYLGLSEQEYKVFLQGDLSTTFQKLMDGQRRYQKFRIYQLDLEGGKTIPFAFSGMAALKKAGHDQPPASEYCLVSDTELICPTEYSQTDVLELIFERYSDHLPASYHGRSISPSDVVELYGEDGRSYFYRDTGAFVPVRFSPLLTKKPGTAAPAKKESAPVIDGERLKSEVDALSRTIHFNAVRISQQADGPHEADLSVFLPDGGKQEGTVTFHGKTHEEARQDLVNTVNGRLNRYVRRVQDMQIKLKSEKRYEVCSRCGKTRLYHLEFRTDYAVPGVRDALNEGMPELSLEDVPYRVGGTYCMDCDAFCDTETRFGAVVLPDDVHDE